MVRAQESRQDGQERGVLVPCQMLGPPDEFPRSRLASMSRAAAVEGTRALFAGAYALLRNPSGHGEVNYDDISEAADAVQTASLLMRILDRIDRRLNP